MKLALVVHEGTFTPGSGGTALLEKEVPTDGTPTVGDSILAWDDGPALNVKKRYWDHDGTLCVELQPIVRLPTPEADEQFFTTPRRHSSGDLDFYWPTAWREEDERYGRLMDELAGSGWQVY